ncbi:unnamed protein product [Blepharisma stoltei]|uniref:HVA22-like protein n=1 Tax=Blepharisma stoltei TaxID=1481888 RepID=A0AAU9JQA0_9CILI|nr:unnamed protein product [Blepharisma stoltei]
MFRVLLFLLSFAICLGYPISQSFRGSAESQKSWISYWLMLGIITYFETSVLSLLPLFYLFLLVKPIFCIWLMHPKYRGINFIENSYFQLAFDQIQQFVKQTPLKIYIEEETVK